MYKNLLYLYLFILPFCFFEVNIACYQQQGIVQNLNRKADFNRCFEPHSDENDVGTVNGNRDGFELQGCLCISCSGDTVEYDIGYRRNEHGAADDVYRRHGLGD